MSSSEEFSDTSSEEYLSDDSECLDFEEIETPRSSVCASHSRTLSIVVFFGGLQASDIRRNLMHADSFLFISRDAASKNHTFFNHFLSLTIKHYRESSHIFVRCPFLTPRSIFGHIWPSGGLMRTIGENIDKTAFTHVLALVKKKDSIFLKIFFENEFLKDIEIYHKKTK